LESILLYGGFIGFILAMPWIDLKLFHPGPHETSTKEAAVWTGVWVGLAAAFRVIVYFSRGGQQAAEVFADI